MGAYTTYGATRSLGDCTYSVSGCSSPEEAQMNIYTRAFRDGNWAPPPLREKWWQFWRPTKYTKLEAHFAALQDDTTHPSGGDRHGE
jgi:hypothetical protein